MTGLGFGQSNWYCLSVTLPRITDVPSYSNGLFLNDDYFMRIDCIGLK